VQGTTVKVSGHGLLVPRPRPEPVRQSPAWSPSSPTSDVAGKLNDGETEGAGGADGLAEANLVAIMVTDAARTVSDTSRTNPKPAMIQAFRRDPGPGGRPAARCTDSAGSGSMGSPDPSYARSADTGT